MLLALIAALLVLVALLVGLTYHYYYYTRRSTKHQQEINQSALTTIAKGANTYIVGTSGSGKSTLAAQISSHFSVFHLELDALEHGPNWTKRHQSRDTFAAEALSLLQPHEHWVADGNYSAVLEHIRDRVRVLVWLDYSLWVILPRLVYRTLFRCVAQVELWNGNRESLWTQFCTKDSLFLWAWSTHRSRAERYEQSFCSTPIPNSNTSSNTNSNLNSNQFQVVRLRSPAETDNWVQQLFSTVVKTKDQ